ncbi:MAG TPA: hypothetical protein VFP32_00330 [Candidatus Saccharimonadales bacterium]|nr:hypothetical protein [Candidatus Saccharimonadales bacterium]
MKKHHATTNITDDVNLRKHYILTRPARLSDLSFDDIDDGAEAGWREKSRQMQARRWRKIRHQVA